MSFMFPDVPETTSMQLQPPAELTYPDALDTKTSLTATEFGNLVEHEREKCRLTRCPGYEYEPQPIPLEPYFLGLWLGDGSRAAAQIANNHEAVNYLKDIAVRMGMHIRYYGGVTYALARNPVGPGRPLPSDANAQ